MKKQNLFYLLFALAVYLCGGGALEQVNAQQATVSKWPRGVTYEIFVQSFADSNGDGIGDIKGMTGKLDYLRDLGVEGIWLMPINPSPSYHKYDVTDYYGIHPDYGTMDDFKAFIRQAHRRNIKVVMDLVINHSSSKHPWFQQALKDENSPYREYYVWTHKNDPQTQKEGRPTGADSDNTKHWHKAPGSDYLFYGYFYDGMPDLNYDSPKLREEMFKVGRFWLNEVGVDGFRLDAARHIFPDERPHDNHQWWVYFRNEMLKAKKDAYLIGEVWAPAEVVGPYMKGLPALFNFDMGFAITKAVNEEKAGELTASHKKIRDFYQSINPGYVDATFLTNHDQNRIMNAVQGDMHKARMAAALLLTLPGSPYLYYGEEIGMSGMKPDEQIREPFLWDVKAKDRSRTAWIKPRYSTDKTVVPLARQMKDKHSMYHHYKTLLHLRNTSRVLTYGDLEPVDLDNPSLCAFIRQAENEAVLVVHNLSKSEITATLPEKLKAYNQVAFRNKNGSVQQASLKLPAYSTVVLKK